MGPKRELINNKSGTLGNGFFGHPEVKDIGFLTLLYAGTTPLFSFKHSVLNETVKELKQWSQSAGNNFVIKMEPQRLYATKL